MRDWEVGVLWGCFCGWVWGGGVGGCGEQYRGGEEELRHGAI